jgi:hypothetical protein
MPAAGTGAPRYKLTRRKRIQALERRLGYLREKRVQLARDDRPRSYLSDEIEALHWALPILQEHVERLARFMSTAISRLRGSSSTPLTR